MEAAARGVFRAYNYQEIRTPILEETQLFARGVGDETDIVTKEMYTFEDRDGSSLTLRPENTASVIRAYIEHRLDQRPGRAEALLHRPHVPPRAAAEGPLPPVLPDRRGGHRFGIAGRGRRSDRDGRGAAEAARACRISAADQLRGRSELPARISSSCCARSCAAVAPQMCGDCQRRAETNPLRVLDCKVEADQPIIEKLPVILDHLCAECRAHFAAVKRYLDDRGIAYEVRPRLVRGLDYYMRTTFEIMHGGLGAQNSVLGGGRYDGLAESLGSKVHSPGIGFSIGEDRLVMSVESGEPAAAARSAHRAARRTRPCATRRCWRANLRRAGISVELRRGQAEARHGTGQQAGRALRPDRGRR